MTMDFRNPPKSGRQRRSEKWETIVKELKENSHQWAFVGNYSPGVAAQMRKGDYRAFLTEGDARPPETQMRQDWEITTRKTDEGRHADVYIRYIGA